MPRYRQHRDEWELVTHPFHNFWAAVAYILFPMIIHIIALEFISSRIRSSGMIGEILARELAWYLTFGLMIPMVIGLLAIIYHVWCEFREHYQWSD